MTIEINIEVLPEDIEKGNSFIQRLVSSRRCMRQADESCGRKTTQVEDDDFFGLTVVATAMARIKTAVANASK
jgi:hypothetical protein